MKSIKKSTLNFIQIMTVSIQKIFLFKPSRNLILGYKLKKMILKKQNKLKFNLIQIKANN